MKDIPEAFSKDSSPKSKPNDTLSDLTITGSLKN